MPRRNNKKTPKMRCSHCNGRVPTRYAKTHIDRCQRARNRRLTERKAKYSREN